MKNKNIITIAALGLAVGAAAYYLLTTEDGKKRLCQANSSIKDLTKSIKKLSKKSAKQASKIAKSCKNEIESIASLVNQEDNDLKNSISEKAKI